MEAYKNHPGSLVMLILTLLAAIIVILDYLYFGKGYSEHSIVDVFVALYYGEQLYDAVSD